MIQYYGQNKVIRVFHRSEIGRLHGMIQRTIDGSYPDYYPTRAIQFFKDYHSVSNIKKRVQSGDLLLLEKEGEIVATGSLAVDVISAVFVLPGFQGRGFGKEIMLELEARARKKGITEITLDVSLPARTFYENLSYEISVLQQIDVGEGQILHYWQAKKKL